MRLDCIQTGSCDALCSCVPDLSADVAINLSDQQRMLYVPVRDAVLVGRLGRGVHDDAFAQMCQTANQQCVAH